MVHNSVKFTKKVLQKWRLEVVRNWVREFIGTLTNVLFNVLWILYLLCFFYYVDHYDHASLSPKAIEGEIKDHRYKKTISLIYTHKRVYLCILKHECLFPYKLKLCIELIFLCPCKFCTQIFSWFKRKLTGTKHASTSIFFDKYSYTTKTNTLKQLHKSFIWN